MSNITDITISNITNTILVIIITVRTHFTRILINGNMYNIYVHEQQRHYYH